jgi:hypothetical protein
MIKTMPQKLIVIELNEVPLRLLRHYAELKPSSAIAHLLEQSLVLKTIANDVEEADLYPSQTWASFNTGIGYQDHEIHWYNDPKPSEYPLYWKIIADSKLSVGLVNTLHSSPASEFIDKGNYKFVIPDCFSPDSFTFPAYYQNFQALNLKATTANSRVTTLEIPVKELVGSLPHVHKFGVTPQTVFDGVGLLANIFAKKVSKERLRGLQFPILADMFLHQLEQNSPDLSILFTNHVAANMHRYWYALFPDDYSDNLYEIEWVEKYKNEIIISLDLADKFFRKLIDVCNQTDSTLLISSSMGQHANQKISHETTTAESLNSKLINASRFIDKLTTRKFDFDIRNGMWPECSLEFSNSSDAADCLEQIKQVIPTLENIFIYSLNLSLNTLTFSVKLDNNKDKYIINGMQFSEKELGFIKFEVDDHHSGCHYPDGSLIVFNSKTADSHSDTVNYLEYAPAILAHFNITKPDYMLDPTFQL